MIECPKCGSIHNVTVARDMKSTRRCGNCYHTWLPAQDIALTPTTLIDVIVTAKQVERLMRSCYECSSDDLRRWRETIVWLEAISPTTKAVDATSEHVTTQGQGDWVMVPREWVQHIVTALAGKSPAFRRIRADALNILATPIEPPIDDMGYAGAEFVEDDETLADPCNCGLVKHVGDGHHELCAFKAPMRLDGGG